MWPTQRDINARVCVCVSVSMGVYGEHMHKYIRRLCVCVPNRQGMCQNASMCVCVCEFVICNAAEKGEHNKN